MREKARRAQATVHNAPPRSLPDGPPRGVKQEEIEDDFVVFAGRRRVFRPGGSAPLTPQAAPTAQDPTLPSDESMIGEWLARQEQYVGYDPHYVAAIEPPPSVPHDQHQHQQHQQQHRDYGYAPEQPQYTLEAVPPPHYMTPPYATYAPPPHPPHQLLHPHTAPHHTHNLHPASSSSQQHAQGMGQQSHVPHPDEMVDMRRDYVVTASAPPELTQLGFAASGSRMSETWLSFIQ